MRRLRDRARLIERELDRVGTTKLALFTGSCEADDAVVAAADAGDVLLVTGADMFEAP